MDMLTLFIRADASIEVGTGHVMRMLALADAWKERGGEVVLLSAGLASALRSRAEARGCRVQEVAAPYPARQDIEAVREALRAHPGAPLVIDGYTFDDAYQAALADIARPLVVIDDNVHARRYHAHVIVNQNLDAQTLIYPCAAPARTLLGPRYVLLRREFWLRGQIARHTPEVARRVLVTMGGSDPRAMTELALKALIGLGVDGLEIVCAIGGSNPRRAAIEATFAQTPGLHLVCDAPDLGEHMAWADLALSAGGTTCWELAFMGLPNAIIVVAENQREPARAFERAGISVLLGEAATVDEQTIQERLEELIHSAQARSSMTRAAQATVDGLGADRVVQAMLDAHGGA